MDKSVVVPSVREGHKKRQNEMEDGKLELTTITKSITHHLDNCRLFRQFSQSSFQHKYYHQTISFGPQKATNICTDTPLHGARKKARQTGGDIQTVR